MNDPWRELAERFSQREMQLFLGPRPGKKSFEKLSSLNLTHCCTLLSKREQVQSVQKICDKLGCDWVWLPVEGGRLELLRKTDLESHLGVLLDKTADTPAPRVYFHCSAGIHRTGFFVYTLLRLRGFDRAGAFEKLSTLRPVTAEQVGEERLDLADELIGG